MVRLQLNTKLITLYYVDFFLHSMALYAFFLANYLAYNVLR